MSVFGFVKSLFRAQPVAVNVKADGNYLGMVLRDAVSGFTGTAMAKYEYLNGNIQYALSKAGDVAGDVPSLDFHLLDVIGPGISTRRLEPDAQVAERIKLGQRVTDRASGLSGITIMKVTYLNGCVGFLVKPSAVGDKASRESEWIDWGRLEVVEDGVLAGPSPTLKATVRGGAMMRSTPRSVA